MTSVGSAAGATAPRSSVACMAPQFHARAQDPSPGQDPAGAPRTLRGGGAAGPPSILAFFRQLGVSYLSFFDEDDEPTRRSTRPGRARSGGTASTDHQTVLIRQAVLVGGVLLFALIVFF